MSEIQIINSMHKSIVDKITQFKNKEIKKDSLNNFMLLNLCHILNRTNKIQAKNGKIQKQQDIEIKKSLSKIKSYHGDIKYNPKELKSNPIMKELVNPTLESYVPISEISYSTEIQFYKKNSDQCNFNESILLKKKNKEELENEDKELNFEEAPLIFLKNENQINHLKNEKKNINVIKEKNDSLFDLINKDDDELFIKEENENKYKTLLFYELTNYLDDDKDYIGNDDIQLDFKKIESFFYLDDIFFNQRYSKRNSTDLYNNFSWSISDSTSFGSGNLSGGDSHISINKDIYNSEFSYLLSIDSFNKFCDQMSIDFLRYMLVVFSNMISTSKKINYFEDKMFLNLMKNFILKIGISSKKLYDKIIQNLVIKKESICKFENFVKCFIPILKLKDENAILKYKFIISLFRLGEEDINVKHINIFFKLIRGKIMYDADLYDQLSCNLIKRYDRIYSSEIGANFKFGNIIICLESFFDTKGFHI